MVIYSCTNKIHIKGVLYMENILNALLNTIFVSIPEESVWVAIVLVGLRRFDLLDWRRWKENIKWLAIPIIPTAIMSNILRYVIKVPAPVMTTTTILVLCSSIIYIVMITDTLNITKKSKTLLFFKTILLFLLSTVIMCLTELSYFPILLFLENISANIINENILNNFLFSFPSRVLQIIILIYIIYNKTFNIKFKQILLIFKDKFLMTMLSVCALITILMILFLVNTLGNNIFINNYSNTLKILVATMIFILPTIFFGIVIANYIYYNSKYIKIQKHHSNMLDELE